MESTNEALCFIFSSLKYFCGYSLSTKIFYLKFFYNEINSNENFPDYGNIFIALDSAFNPLHCLVDFRNRCINVLEINFSKKLPPSNKGHLYINWTLCLSQVTYMSEFSVQGHLYIPATKSGPINIYSFQYYNP